MDPPPVPNLNVELLQEGFSRYSGTTSPSSSPKANSAQGTGPEWSPIIPTPALVRSEVSRRREPPSVGLKRKHENIVVDDDPGWSIDDSMQNKRVRTQASQLSTTGTGTKRGLEELEDEESMPHKKPRTHHFEPPVSNHSSTESPSKVAATAPFPNPGFKIWEDEEGEPSPRDSFGQATAHTTITPRSPSWSPITPPLPVQPVLLPKAEIRRNGRKNLQQMLIDKYAGEERTDGEWDEMFHWVWNDEPVRISGFREMGLDVVYQAGQRDLLRRQRGLSGENESKGQWDRENGRGGAEGVVPVHRNFWSVVV